MSLLYTPTVSAQIKKLSKACDVLPAINMSTSWQAENKSNCLARIKFWWAGEAKSQIIPL